ncbi:hypothetical protein EG327_001562 [Venturia inaequalis]|uniref:Uncharacterized protein n=1 Tax=Venturia inaequalis TaxID=5025 RepID=A0A8H3VME0_VENIN|nr:hypothetical protein EG327_001562 [Venturia inaequalis]
MGHHDCGNKGAAMDIDANAKLVCSSQILQSHENYLAVRVGKVKTWMVIDTLSYNRLQRFHLCHDDLQLFDPSEALKRYTITYHPEIGPRPTKQQRNLRAFEAWLRSIFLHNVPNEVEIWQVDLSRDEARTKKAWYENFYGIKLVQWTRKIPHVEHPRREEIDTPVLKSARMIRTEWDAEEDGWENKRTGRYFVTMPDYCFIGDNSQQEQREPWDAFGECSKATFNTTMQPVEEEGYINIKCTLKDRAGHDFQQWRAYLYEMRPMRRHDRPSDKEKRERYPLTEEETEDEHSAKRRWSAYQRGNHGAPDEEMQDEEPQDVEPQPDEMEN